MTEQMNVPKLRFGEFEGDWNTEKLGAYSKHITYGLTVRPKFVEDGIPLISAREITSGEVKYSQAPQISLSEFNNLSDKAKPIVGDLFLSKTGTIGFSAQNTTSQPVAITQNIAVIRIDDANVLSPNYVLHYFKTNKFYRSAVSKVNQSTIMDLQLGDIKRLPIPLPPNFLEQQKIVSFLSKVDEKIALLNEKKDKLTEYKKGVMQQLFNGKWEEQDGQLTFIPPTLRFKADDGSEHPDWEEAQLGEFVEINSGYSPSKFEMKASGVPYFKVEQLNNSTKYQEVTPTYIADFDKTIPAGSIIFPKRGASILLNKVRILVHDSFMDTNLMTLTAKPELNNEFLFYFLVKEDLSKIADTTSIPQINNKHIIPYPLILPSIAEQLQIANFLSAIDKKIDLAQSEHTKAKEWKKGLLQQMFV
ncbi:TPA: restriction endonuclease subunit S [Vibrio parahaemolyticus]|uniref:restriction endonuclease subunit S n=1 Tax=Vibrio parahaemolyticus TaxID=670 RepID=UPI0006A57C2F|nr:restriction endonuclease subunit S [Vibrio parahaemolyticus]KOE78842.1 hypothetical protein ACS87_02720 [Vibrio parahaemolyticus]HAS6494091.1 restriction endonuclease subunit S [Vibrio parahaemolyticus]HAS6507700.1 restriction endonuclease subunit S [Vibrio parahaemolyticus]HAS6514423.1 restriction endonuclease subunit S [Vibrio parahaemolyticus]HAS6524178.1 restriction endonuclease subunit S [Vibrio parahaemolyticus]